MVKRSEERAELGHENVRNADLARACSPTTDTAYDLRSAYDGGHPAFSSATMH